MFLGDIAKAVFEFLLQADSATVRAVTYNLELTDDEARQGLHDLMAAGLVDAAIPERFFLTRNGAAMRARRL